MTFQQELSSWLFPANSDVSTAPEVGSQAPSTSKIPLPNAEGSPTIVTFLRHCGCPFAEKTFMSLRALAAANPDLACIAVSHSSQPATDKWLASLPESNPANVQVVVDEEREVYARWGLGASSLWHVLSPSALWSVYTLGKSEGIWNRRTESGTRWQTSGSWAVDSEGIVRWGGVAQSASDIPNFEDALRALCKGSGPKEPEAMPQRDSEVIQSGFEQGLVWRCYGSRC